MAGLVLARGTQEQPPHWQQIREVRNQTNVLVCVMPAKESLHEVIESAFSPDARLDFPCRRHEPPIFESKKFAVLMEELAEQTSGKEKQQNSGDSKEQHKVEFVTTQVDKSTENCSNN